MYSEKLSDMRQANNVLLVIERTESLLLLQEKLEQYGATITMLRGAAELPQACNDAVDLLVLPVEPGFLSLLVARLHSELPSLGIIALPGVQSTDQRVQLLLTGADACLFSDVEVPEILAWSHALRRRVNVSQTAEVGVEPNIGQVKGAELPATWQLQEKGWTLLAPNGLTLELTHSERQLMDAFLSAPDARISRDDLMRDKGMNVADSRAVDSLISRLRRKASQRGIALPIKSVHGWGYTFAGPLQSLTDHRERGAAVEPDAQDLPTEEALSEQKLALLVAELMANPAEFNRAQSFSYQVQVAINTGQISGVDAEPYWTLANGQRYDSEQLLARVPSALMRKQTEDGVVEALLDDINCWWQEYGLRSQQVSLRVSADYLRQTYKSLCELSLQRKLGFEVLSLDVVFKAHHELDASYISILNYLRSHKIKVYLSVQSLAAEQINTLENLPIVGVKFEAPILQQAMGDAVFKMSLELALHRIHELGLEAVLKGVDSVELRELALGMEISHYQGLLTSDWMSRDALLLTLACTHAN